MKIYIVTDMEGVTGVCDFDNYCADAGIHYQNSRRLLTLEVNAAVAGFFAGGATEIEVLIGHHSDSVDRELLDSRVLLLNGRSDPPFPGGLDASFDALAFVGQHAKAGSDYAHLAHTGNLAVTEERVNGVSIGEYGQMALCAMDLGIPTIFASGDRAMTLEAEALTPGVVTVYGKWGRNADGGRSLALDSRAYRNFNLASVQMHPEVVRARIRAGAERAVRKLIEHPEAFRFPNLRGPYTLRREHRADGDTPEFALVGEGATFAEAINRMYAPDNPRIPLEQREK